MKKRIFTRALALLMTLSLLSTTAFAASFTDLQDAIDGNTTGTLIEDTGRYGYAWNQENRIWGIEAWNTTNEDGSSTRNVQLNEDVTYGENGTTEAVKNININGYYQSIDRSDDEIPDVTIDLAGHDIDGNRKTTGAVIEVGWSAQLTVKDSTAHVDEDSGEYVAGAITGGTSGGVSVASKGTFTLENGAIAGNSTTGQGGGVNVSNAQFIMNGGQIKNNSAKGNGGGVNVFNSAEFTMNGGSIANNTTDGKGGGITINSASLIMSDGEISNNYAKGGGGGVLVNVGIAAEMKGGSVHDNNTDERGGGVLVQKGTFTMSGGSIYENHAGYGGGIAAYTDDQARPAKIVMNDGAVSQNTADGAGNDIVIARSAHFTINGLTYTLNYENGEQATLEDGTTATPQIVTIKVQNPDGSQVGELVKTTSLFGADARFAVNRDGSSVRIELAEETIDTETIQTYGFGGYVDSTGFHPYPAPPATTDPESPDTPTGGDTSDSDTNGDTFTPGDFTFTDDSAAATGTTITDEEVPLAGLLTQADLLEELRQYEGIEDVELPEDFKWIDHEYAQAIYWGLETALVVDTEDDPLDPDELLTVGLMREVLTNFVELYHGLEDFEVVLEGEDEDLVMDYVDMISRLAAFYEELEAALEAKAA